MLNQGLQGLCFWGLKKGFMEGKPHVNYLILILKEISHKNNLSIFLTFLIMILKFLHKKKITLIKLAFFEFL